MIKLHLTRGNNYEGVYLRFPATPGEIGECFSRLDGITADVSSTRIIDVTSRVRNLRQYIRNTNITIPENIGKLNTLATRIDDMAEERRCIFSGALDSESVNGIDDVLRISESLNEYLLIPEVTTDRELGNYLVEKGFLENCPENVLPYLDYVGIGAEFYSECGGAYTLDGYVVRKNNAPELYKNVDQPEPWRNENLEEVICLKLQTPKMLSQGERYCLVLPADDTYLDDVARYIGVDNLNDAEILEIEYRQPYLSDMLPPECSNVDGYNELAELVAGMLEDDGEYMKYLSALEVEYPETFQESLEIARNLDDYERVPDDCREYGITVLRRLGIRRDAFETIYGHINFESLGETAMREEDVRRTEFGLVRRLSSPFEEQGLGQEMGGM